MAPILPIARIVSMLRIASIATALLPVLLGCGPAQEPGASVAPGAGSTDYLRRVQEAGKPEITTDHVSKDVIGHKIVVPELTGSGPADEWTFEADEYRSVEILERQPTDSGVDLLIFMLTRNNPREDEHSVQVSGRLQLHYEWKGGKWVLTRIQNLTFRYSVGMST